MIEIREATPRDVAEFYDGQGSMMSLRGFVAVADGKVIAIAGVYYEGIKQIAFSEMKEEMKSRKKDIVRLARRVMSMIEQRRLAVWATCSDDRSSRFVGRCGFNPGPVIDGKRVMLWNG
mgnify:CR=1 FL=1